MKNSVYQINKGINQSIEFKGLKAQYIWYLGGGVVVLLILFAILYFVGLSSIMCIAITGGAGVLLVIRMSNKYEEHGLMKTLARRRVPGVIRSRNRKIFISL